MIYHCLQTDQFITYRSTFNVWFLHFLQCLIGDWVGFFPTLIFCLSECGILMPVCLKWNLHWKQIPWWCLWCWVPCGEVTRATCWESGNFGLCIWYHKLFRSPNHVRSPKSRWRHVNDAWKQAWFWRSSQTAQDDMQVWAHSHLSAIRNIEYHRWSYQTDALLMNFGQISSESTHIMDCDYHCIFVLRDLFVSGLYLIRGCNSHRESRGRFPWNAGTESPSWSCWCCKIPGSFQTCPKGAVHP